MGRALIKLITFPMAKWGGRGKSHCASDDAFNKLSIAMLVTIVGSFITFIYGEKFKRLMPYAFLIF
jgi:hypothetical protein